MSTTDLDLEIDVALALAAYYDDPPSPRCTCVETQRGRDVLGCPVHDPDEPAPAATGGEGGVR